MMTFEYALPPSFNPFEAGLPELIYVYLEFNSHVLPLLYITIDIEYSRDVASPLKTFPVKSDRQNITGFHSSRLRLL